MKAWKAMWPVLLFVNVVCTRGQGYMNVHGAALSVSRERLDSLTFTEKPLYAELSDTLHVWQDSLRRQHEADLARWPVWLTVKGDTVVVNSKYDAGRDLSVLLCNRSTNYLFDFTAMALVENASDTVAVGHTGDLLSYSLTDWMAPLYVFAEDGTDGDFQYPVQKFVGGVHGYGNEIDNTRKNVTPTAREVGKSVWVNGREWTAGSVRGHYVDIYVKNRLQASNTQKSDGSGREVLEQTWHLHFDGYEWQVTSQLEALEDVRLSYVIGLDFWNYLPEGTVRFVGSKAMTGEYPVDQVTRSGDLFCSMIVMSDGEHRCECEIDRTFGIGDCESNQSGFNAQVTDARKSYFNLLNVKDWEQMPCMRAGESLFFRGVYRFLPDIAVGL